MEIKICHLYSDLLNLYGDRGNIITLAERSRRRNIDVTVKNLTLGERAHLNEYDLFFIGGGQDVEQAALINELSQWRGMEIKSAIEDGKPMLAICGGYQLLGHYYKTWDGKQMDFIGALDLYTEGGQMRMIGDYMFQCNEPQRGVNIVGFENHSGKTYLGSGVKPFGRVIKGHGNNGEDGTEGARYLNVIGTYSHGPLLPKNPILADWLIRLTLERKYGSANLEPLDDVLENRANKFMVSRLNK
ncbi:MAG: type 1 glutamine amidotransferase [Lachnospiraceae bacterium]